MVVSSDVAVDGTCYSGSHMQVAFVTRWLVVTILTANPRVRPPSTHHRLEPRTMTPVYCTALGAGCPYRRWRPRFGAPLAANYFAQPWIYTLRGANNRSRHVLQPPHPCYSSLCYRGGSTVAARPWHLAPQLDNHGCTAVRLCSICRHWICRPLCWSSHGFADGVPTGHEGGSEEGHEGGWEGRGRETRPRGRLVEGGARYPGRKGRPPSPLSRRGREAPSLGE